MLKDFNFSLTLFGEVLTTFQGIAWELWNVILKRKAMNKFQMLVSLCLVFGFGLTTQAQEKDKAPKEGEIKVVVIKNENGNVSKVDESFSGKKRKI